jgi:hypothetical protein
MSSPRPLRLHFLHVEQFPRVNRVTRFRTKAGGGPASWRSQRTVQSRHEVRTSGLADWRQGTEHYR